LKVYEKSFASMLDRELIFSILTLK